MLDINFYRIMSIKINMHILLKTLTLIFLATIIYFLKDILIFRLWINN